MIGPFRRTPPSHHLDIGPQLPVWVLRSALVAVTTTAVTVIGAPPMWIIVTAVLGTIGAFFPPCLGTYLTIPAVAIVLLGQDAALWRTAVAVLVVNLTVAVAALSSTLPARTRIALRALLPSGRRLAITQLIAQPLALGVGALASGVDVGFPALAVVAAVAILGLVIGSSRLLRRGSGISR